MAQNHNADYSEKPMTTYGRTQGPSRRYRRLRHPTFPAAEWTAKNPLLQRGEIGIESDTHKAKVGDGTTYWNTLPYSFVAETEWGYIVGDINDQTDLIELVDDKVAAEAGLRSDADDGLQDQITDNKDTMDDHIANTNNPHNVTASQVGLGNVDNTSDADKPISTATQDALDLKANIADLGTAAYTDSTDYATAAQGTKADSALQPGDNVSDLVNDAGYLTQHQTLADLGITATASEINVLDGITASTTELNYVDGVTSNIQTQIDGKQPKSTSAYNMGNTSGGWTAMSNTQQDALNSGANTTNIGQIATNTSNIADEIIDRQNADNGLQSQIDAIVSKSDVVDIVGTYAELQAYDTSSLGNNDVVKVISDSTHNDAPSYYRWVISGGVGSWVYIGSESETYTKAETDALLNAKQDNITATDGITLTGTTLTNSGVRAVTSGTANGTISVNTNGTSADVAVTGLGSAAYTSSSDYATSAQGGKADTAVQPGDNVSDLNNDAGYQTAGDVATAISGKQDTLTAGTNITIIGTTISATDTTYSDFTGATAGDAGTNGLVPAPAAGDQAKFLQGDGTWANPTAATAWGNITGTLSDQTDLQNALAGKADTATTLAGYGITDGANTDLSNLTSTGANIGNWSSNVTNCIINIPQDIKLELSSGTVTLKAGSKIYVPNGVDTFNVITTISDITDSTTISDTNTRFMYYNNGALKIFGTMQSGTTPPSTGTNVMFYNTSDNTIKRYTSGSVVDTDYSFPLAKVTADGTHLVGTINQVFNGFGYIGNSIYALPGVSGLIPNGRNDDGTLKSTAFTTSSVLVTTRNISGTNGTLVLGDSVFSNYAHCNYDVKNNFNTNNSGDVLSVASVGVWSANSSGNITKFEPISVFQATDYNDLIRDYSKTDTGYIKLPNSRIIIQWGRGNNTISSNNMSITFPTPFTSATSYAVTGSTTYSSSTSNGWGYINSCTSTGFKAVLDNNSKPFNWLAIGY